MRSIVAAVFIALLVATPAEAKVYELAKFKILSVSGSRELTFTEDSALAGGRCTGTTSARIDFRSTSPLTVYMNVRRIHGRRKVVVSDKAKPPQSKYVQMDGEATVSRSVDYQASAGCYTEPTACAEATVPAKVQVFGTDVPSAGVGADPVDVGGDIDCSVVPRIPLGALRFAPQSTYSDVFSWSELFGKDKRVEGTSRVEEPVTADDPRPGDSLSGLLADETTIVMKRLKLEESLQRRR